MPAPRHLFPGALRLDFTGDLPAQTRALPARHAVALLLADDDRPLQLLAGRDIRAIVRRRIEQADEQPASKRVNYREVLREVLWREVSSPFEEDWILASGAREAFPDTWHDLVRLPQPWFVQLDLHARFPRWTATRQLATPAPPSLVQLGPIPEKRLAEQWVETIEDVFDLCRYHHILTQAPLGKACAYKDMGRCPAPCDGTVPLDVYRRRIADSARDVLSLDATLRQLEDQMQQAAAALSFERAATLKRRIEALKHLQDRRFRSLHLAQSPALLIAAPGPRTGSFKLFLWRTDGVIHALSLIGAVNDDVVDTIRDLMRSAPPHPAPLPEDAEIASALLCRVILRRKSPEVCLPASELDASHLQRRLQEIETRDDEPATALSPK